ncbi:uncharacterized protein LOC113550585 [Rhopalosiphum maidis]|uniref:uncharacterized protein LOC113550585 n=1 Tax=Rhopalosiphum maidis TaxID=43146 RepID=UPI000EFFA1AA|nr:uncharacterized protein LOC113550585 [Rhopalosiphum maidis]
MTSHVKNYEIRRCSRPVILYRAVVLVIVLQPIIADTGSSDVYGTTLYKLTDDRKMWTFDERIKLQCRMTVGSLVPGANFSDSTGEIFLVYFELIKIEAKKIVSSSVRKSAMIIVVDVLGGYLHANLLPRVKEQYYEGRAKYSTVKKLHELEKNIKHILGTDGRGWARPTLSGHRSEEDVAPTVRRAGWPRSTVRPRDDDKSAGHCRGVNASQYGLLRRWRPTKKAAAGAADADDVYTDAVPFFDNDTLPHSLVVPWRSGRPVLYSVWDAGCHQTLFDYLVTATAAGARVRRTALRQWLDEVVLPLVKAPATDRWYPALWGVTLVARRLAEADRVGPGVSRDNRQLDCDWTTADAPNVNFYAFIVLLSTGVCWSAAALYIAIGGHSFGFRRGP